MAEITLRVLDGAERGRVFERIPTPVTIGREEGNTIQLNDERISRFHVKIQEDHDQVVVTDLESTNGTKVNGEDIQLRILRFGDILAVGRSVLLFGSQEEIAQRLARLREKTGEGQKTLAPEESPLSSKAESLEFDLNFCEDSSLQSTLRALHPPELPRRISPGQAAQLSELLEYFHVRLRHLLESVEPDDASDGVVLKLQEWQCLLELQGQLAKYLREIGEPER